MEGVGIVLLSTGYWFLTYEPRRKIIWKGGPGSQAKS